MKKALSVSPLFFCSVLICSILTGCNPGENLEQGALVYNASEVFDAGTREHALAISAARGQAAEIDKLVNAGVNVNAIGRTTMASPRFSTTAPTQTLNARMVTRS